MDIGEVEKETIIATSSYDSASEKGRIKKDKHSSI